MTVASKFFSVIFSTAFVLNSLASSALANDGQQKRIIAGNNFSITDFGNLKVTLKEEGRKKFVVAKFKFVAQVTPTPLFIMKTFVGRPRLTPEGKDGIVLLIPKLSHFPKLRGPRNQNPPNYHFKLKVPSKIKRVYFGSKVVEVWSEDIEGVKYSDDEYKAIEKAKKELLKDYTGGVSDYLMYRYRAKLTIAGVKPVVYKVKLFPYVDYWHTEPIVEYKVRKKDNTVIEKRVKYSDEKNWRENFKAPRDKS